jgi:hypothetical protein
VSSCVFLRCNRITGDALDALARADLSPGLRSLKLDHNPLGGIRAESVARVLQACPMLRLSVGDCSIPLGTQEELGRMFSGRVYTGLQPAPSQPPPGGPRGGAPW